MADTITLRTSTERDVVKIVERGPQGPAGGGGGGSGTVTSVALAGTGLSITGSPVTSSGTITANVVFGTTAGTACQGNDSRLSNARTPTAHAASHASAGSDPLTLEDLTNQAVQNGSIGTFNDGAPYGIINTSWGGSTTSYGGSIDTHGDDYFGAGGSINTSAGGGSIDTRGTGSIQFGVSGTRTTLTGTATADRAVSLPDAAGTLALTSDLHTRSHAITSTSDHTATANRVFYSNSSGQVTELALGAANTVLTSNGATSAPSFSALPSGGSKTYFRATALDNQPPSSTGFATLDSRGTGIAVLDFDDASTESAVFVGVMPEGASLGSGLIVYLHFMATTATSGNVRWSVAFERSNTDLDADSFDNSTAATVATNGTSGIVTVGSITCTTIDSITAGDLFRLRVQRLGADAADTMSGDAELVAVEIRSAA